MIAYRRIDIRRCQHHSLGDQAVKEADERILKLQGYRIDSPIYSCFPVNDKLFDY